MTSLVEPVTIYLPCGGVAKFVEYGSSAYHCETCGYQGVAGGEDNACYKEIEKFKEMESQGTVEWTDEDDNL